MAIEFEDNRVEVKQLIKDAGIAWLNEACGEFVSQAMRNTKVRTGKTKGSWRYVIDRDEMRGIIGNTIENAVWEELGTGEYALEGKGRQDAWFVHVGNGPNDINPIVVNSYGFRKFYGKDGEIFIRTKGKRPRRMLFNAYTKLKPKVERALENLLKNL